MPKKKIKNIQYEELINELKNISVKLYNLEFELFNDNIKADGKLPENVALLHKEVLNTRKYVEQLVYMLGNYLA